MKINKSIEKRESRKLLRLNFNILIKDIQDLVFYLENILIHRDIKDKHIFQNLNYHQILIDYNKIYNNEKMLMNLLEFYIFRKEIKEHSINYMNEIESSDKNSSMKKAKYIRFIAVIYKKLDDLFVKNQLESQLKKWNKNFSFKPFEQIKKERQYLLISRKCKLNGMIDNLIKEHNIILKDSPDRKERKLESNLRDLGRNHNSIIQMEEQYSEHGYSSTDEVHCGILKMTQEIYDIKQELLNK